MKISGRFLLLQVLFVALVNAAFAQAPKTLSYQGTLSDSTGPLTGSHNLTFKIYDAASGGTALWTETNSGVSVSSGNVSLTLGKIVPINIQTVKPLWIGITVDANSEISPRVELSASLYSIGLALPYAATVTNGVPNLGSVMNLTYNGDSAVAIMRLNFNGSALANPFVVNHMGTGAAMVLTQSGTLGTGAIFSLSNSANPQPAIRGTTFGTGSAGVFQVNNASSSAPVISITHTGTGNAITTTRPIEASKFIGDGSLLTNLPSSGGLTLPFSGTENDSTVVFSVSNSGAGHGIVGKSSGTSNNAGVYGTALGFGTSVMGETSTGWSAIFGYQHNPNYGWAGNFENDSPTNNWAALRATTGGTGPALEASTGTGWTAIYGLHSGDSTGHAGKFEISHASNTWAALEASTAGPGNAIRGTTSTGWAAISGVSGGTGTGIHGANNGSGNGFAGLFENTKASNIYPAIQASSRGGGSSGVRVLQGDSSLARGIDVFMTNSTTTQEGLYVNTLGLGMAANFGINNTASYSSAVQAYSTSNGATIHSANGGLGGAGVFNIDNPTSSAPVIEINQAGSGYGIYSNGAILATAFIGDGSQLTGISTPALQLPYSGGTGSGTGFSVDHSGTDGYAANFSISNPASEATVLNIGNAGTGNAISATGRIEATSFSGDGSQLSNLPPPSLPFQSTSGSASTLFAVTNNGDAGAAAFAVDNTGNAEPVLSASTNGVGFAGLFTNTNSDNGYGILSVNSNGQGPSFAATSSGTGLAGSFDITDSGNTSAALGASTVGLGGAASFYDGNVTSAAPVVTITGAGSGNSITANGTIQANAFVGDGSGLTNLPSGSFSLPINATSNYASTLFNITSTGDGIGGIFSIDNTASTTSALAASTNGTGVAVSFYNSNPDNYNPVLDSRTNGVGPAAFFNVENTGALYPAMSVTTNASSNPAVSFENTGSGGAGAQAGTFRLSSPSSVAAVVGSYQMGLGASGEFNIQNAENDSWALAAVTNGTGPAFIANSAGNGRAIKIISGGLQYNVTYVNSSTSIEIRSAVYSITGGGTDFTLDYGASDGDTCIAYNGTGSPITVGGVSLATDETRQLVYISGWRGL